MKLLERLRHRAQEAYNEHAYDKSDALSYSADEVERQTAHFDALIAKWRERASELNKGALIVHARATELHSCATELEALLRREEDD